MDLPSLCGAFGRCPQIQGGARVVAGLLPALSPLRLCILVHGSVEERQKKKKKKKKKDPELVTGMVTISLDYPQLFPISKQGCKGKSIVVVGYLSKGKCCLVGVQPGKAWWIGQDVLACHVSR